MKLTRRVLFRAGRLAGFEWPYQNQRLADEMLAFMRHAGGIGLAAPQIGRSLRLFVMEVQGRTRICFNPEIVEASQNTADFPEACLSFPNEQCIIKRPDTIIVRYQDADGVWTETNLVGLEARCFQHELDHLDGITMHERAKGQHATES